MGAGAIFVGHMAEMVIPTLLIFALTYSGAKNTWSIKSGWGAILGLFVVTVLVAGLVNALLHDLLDPNGYGMIAIIAIPLIVSLAVIYFFAPRHKKGPA